MRQILTLGGGGGGALKTVSQRQNMSKCYFAQFPNTKTEEKCVGQFSYGFNILDKLEGCTHKKKIPYGDLDFSI